MYVGVCEGGGLRTTFDMVYLRYTPPQYNHLAGLTELFKAKLVKQSNRQEGLASFPVSTANFVDHVHVCIVLSNSMIWKQLYEAAMTAQMGM